MMDLTQSSTASELFHLIPSTEDNLIASGSSYLKSATSNSNSERTIIDQTSIDQQTSTTPNGMITVDMSFNRRSLDWYELERESPFSAPRDSVSQHVKDFSPESNRSTHSDCRLMTPVIQESLQNWDFPSEPPVPPRLLLWGPYSENFAPMQSPLFDVQDRDSGKSNKRTVEGMDEFEVPDKSSTSHHNQESIATPEGTENIFIKTFPIPKKRAKDYRNNIRIQEQTRSQLTSIDTHSERQPGFEGYQTPPFPLTPTTPYCSFNTSPSLNFSPQSDFQSYPADIPMVPYSFNYTETLPATAHHLCYHTCNEPFQAHIYTGFQQCLPTWSEQWYHTFHHFRQPQILPYHHPQHEDERHQSYCPLPSVNNRFREEILT
ncbi:hypothetical protein BY996DRAFT_6423213 [Phakopsora pachyrhizi]|uniref:Expressed protein n=1 Tax=Phakopsora pachyrhizi TaxID=170000 RepID=A0AAV0B166_PHAPC|nr:hypothetical protein BY996DRAFT_6423213 [Phakopsora pachyrhizi]CAH7675728.1 expressed protein [Phakopsora pachyrhizi]